MRKFYLLLACLLSFFSCKKNNDSNIPNVHVDFNLYLTQPSNAALNSVGNWVYVSNYGVRGIIVYHRTQDEFAAYDRACPYDYEASGSLIVVDSNTLSFVDPHCGSKFNILTGAVEQGPATASMKVYRADYDGSSVVYVHN
jgi:nitrite reductase/ring-hydroxylating ferredoxin subunit